MLKENKIFLQFLAKFLITYVVFTLVYNFYLSGFDKQKFAIDDITTFVAKKVEVGLQLFDNKAIVEKLSTETSYKVVFKDKYLTRIIEGCNAVNVLILFVSFVFAFSSTLKKTLLFTLFGVVLIFILNILRIVFINIISFYFTNSHTFIHDILFPVMIYGIVFALWYYWVVKFSKS
jgi:exosortase family protein XrtF